MEAFVPVQPTLNSRMLVRGVVVADDVDLLFGRHGFIDQAQKFQPFVMTMPLLALTIDLAGSGVECGKQRGGTDSIALMLTERELRVNVLPTIVLPHPRMGNGL
jgi:hypothetical protein